jgi:hypothetical protein
MASKFKVLASMLAPGGKLFCVAGDVRIRRTGAGDNGPRATILPLGEMLARTCATACPGLRVSDYDSHNVNRSTRYLHAINKTNGHTNHAIVERIFMAEKR